MNEDEIKRRILALEERYIKTYKARLEQQKRFNSSGKAWTWLLIVSSTMTLVASVVMLRDSAFFDENGDVLVTILSLLTLIGSLTSSSLRLQERSRDSFHAYRSLQKLTVKLEQLKASTSDVSELRKQVQGIENQYDQIIDSTENHHVSDYVKGVLELKEKKGYRAQSTVSFLETYGPYVGLIPSLFVLYQVFMWLF